MGPTVPQVGHLLVGAEVSDDECAIFVEAGEENSRREAARRSRTYLASAALTATVLLGAAAALRGRPSWAVASKEFSVGEFIDFGSQDDRCHTAREGELCWKDVRWAITTGITEHPEWYAGTCPHLKPTSAFEEFQACVYKINMTSCPLPCNPSDGVSDEVVARTHRQANKRPHLADPCHSAQKGEDCYDDVLDAMVRGVISHPDRYPGLTADSSFEQFQQALYEDPTSSSCPRPCACKTALPGDQCYKHVLWAQQEGIKGHPDWYHGLHADSTFEEVQAYLAKESKGSCTYPCASVDVAHARNSIGDQTGLTGKGSACFTDNWPDIKRKLVCGKCKVLVDKFSSKYKTCERYCTAIGRKCTGAWMDYDDTCSVLYPMTCKETIASDDALCECGKEDVADDVETPVTDAVPEEPAAETRAEEAEQRSDGGVEVCHTAVPGQICYDDVMFGMTKGIQEHPEWYAGLSPRSTFEDFQKMLHGNRELNCPKPCSCHTARNGEQCVENVKWVLREGIPQHPSWYQGLTVRSRFEEVQKRLREDENTTCGKPCTMRKWNTPSLFCIAVFRSQGYESELLKAQLDKNVGVFSCDDVAVLADKKMRLAEGLETLVIPPNEQVGVSKDGTAANTMIFIKAWLLIWQDTRWQAHDWIIKADPDAVIIPERLRQHLAPHTGKNVFVKNCMKYSGPGWPMMFGSVEAFSNEALMTYMKGADRCRTQLQWQAWGEDLFMGNCISMLGGGSIFDGGLVGDGVCKGANCGDGSVAAFHPFKSVEKWFQCYHQATR